MTADTILELWSQHEAAAFPPELRDREHQGIDLVLLDADIAGCVSTALTRGRLDRSRAALLRSLAPIAASAARETPPGDARAYLDRLAELAQRVLESRPS